MEVESPEHTREFAEVDINNGDNGVESSDEEEEVPAPGSITLAGNETDLFVSAMSPSSIEHVSAGHPAGRTINLLKFRGGACLICSLYYH